MDDVELEQAVRDGLERRAAQADDMVPIADRARSAVRHRRGRRLAAGLAIASVAAVAVVGLVLDDDDDVPSRPPVGMTDDGADQVPDGTAWRTEYWAGLAVDVPADWGFGITPDRGGSVCGGQAAMYDASGDRLPWEETMADPGDLPFVGRPIMQSDLCIGGLGPPDVPYVWLGSEIERGIVELDGGAVQETVVVEGTGVTVSTTDAALRRRILDSARRGDLCAGDLAGPPQPGPMLFEGIGEPVGTTVCIYRRARNGIMLAHAVRLDADQTGALVSAVGDGRPLEVDRDCATGYIWVTLEVEGVAADDRPVGAGGSELWVVDPLCGVVRRDLQTLDLTPAMVRPWSGGGTAIALGSFGLGASVLDSVLTP